MSLAFLSSKDVNPIHSHANTMPPINHQLRYIAAHIIADIGRMKKEGKASLFIFTFG